MTPPTAAAPAPSVKPPLAVDLDGTLIRADVFTESILRFLFAKPWKLPILLFWLSQGRAYAKAKLADAAPCDPKDLPYDERVIAWLREEQASGRRIVLATASDQKAAVAIANHVGVFDDVFASDGVVNLKSRRKAERLAEAFPEGFAYAGNESADLKVWAAASQAVIVNAAPGLAKRVRCAVETTFPRERNPLQGFIKAVRPQQWAKNVLVFLPLLVGQGWLNIAAWQHAALAFVALCCAASSVYLVNDAADIDADRRHPRKRNRPFASGVASPIVGLVLAALLFIAGFAYGFAAGVPLLIGVYLVTSTLYTFWLKRVVLIDVFVLASLYTLRVVLGGVASGYVASSWLLAFSCFFFLSLALVKRVVEVRAMQAVGAKLISRRGYHTSDGPVLTTMGLAAGFVSALVLALYTQSDIVATHYHAPRFLWALPAAIVFWLCRVWLMTARGEMHDDPLAFAMKDRVSWLVGLGAAAAFAAAALA